MRSVKYFCPVGFRIHIARELSSQYFSASSQSPTERVTVFVSALYHCRFVVFDSRWIGRLVSVLVPCCNLDPRRTQRKGWGRQVVPCTCSKRQILLGCDCASGICCIWSVFAHLFCCIAEFITAAFAIVLKSWQQPHVLPHCVLVWMPLWLSCKRFASVRRCVCFYDLCAFMHLNYTEISAQFWSFVSPKANF